MANNCKGLIGIVIVVICITICILLQEPIAQSIDYHAFKDNRTFIFVPNFLNVISNLAFVVVGVIGLYNLLVSKNVVIVEKFKAGYIVLFLGLLLIGFGSGYYHLWPNNETLVWDRLPMTLSFMALVAIIITEYISINTGKQLLYPLLMLGGGSVAYWNYTESIDAGDLRFYILIQFIPLVIIPLILLVFKPVFSHGNRYWWLLLAYVLAKFLEHFDAVIFETLSIVSGHTLKHLLAAFGMFCLLSGYKKRKYMEVKYICKK